MLDLCRSQIYKLIHSKYYIIILINVLINILGVSLFKITTNQSSTVEGYSLLYLVISNGGILIFEILAIIFAAYFIASEFKQGNIKALVTYGNKRKYIYLSKLAITMLGISVLLISSMITGIVSGTIIFGFGSSFNLQLFGELTRTFILTIFVSFAFSSIYVLISFIFKEPGLIIGIYIGFTVIITNLLFAQLSMRFEWIKRVFEFLPKTQLYNVASLNISFSTTLNSVIYTIAVTVLTTILGTILFEKMDIN